MNVWQLLGPSEAKGTERLHPPHSAETQARTISIAQWVSEHTDTQTKSQRRASGHCPGQQNFEWLLCTVILLQFAHWSVAAPVFVWNENNALHRLHLLCTTWSTCHKIQNHSYARRHWFCNLLKTTFHAHVLIIQNTVWPVPRTLTLGFGTVLVASQSFSGRWTTSNMDIFHCQKVVNVFERLWGFL